MNKYLYGGYLDFVEEWGKLDSRLSKLIQEAVGSLEKMTPDAETKTEQAIFAIKSKGIP